MKNVLITGGAGFIAHHIIAYMIKNTDWNIIAIDRLDLSGNLNRLDDILSEFSTIKIKFSSPIALMAFSIILLLLKETKITEVNIFIFSYFIKVEKNGGESGIRTHGTCEGTHTFQACALNHSATSPIQIR